MMMNLVLGIHLVNSWALNLLCQTIRKHKDISPLVVYSLEGGEKSNYNLT
jgi:hypothetical protein